MLRKTLLTTSALMVAGSVALASPHGPLRPAHTLAQLQQLHREALEKKGMILDRKGVPVAILRPPAAHARNGAAAKSSQPPLLEPGKRDSFGDFGKKNALYLSWFGWFAGNSTVHEGPYSGSFCYSYSGSKCVNYYKYKYSLSESITQSAAQPFPALKSASSISLAVGPYTGGKGKVALYTNHAGTTSNPCATTSSAAPSCPGNPIAGASGTFSAHGGSSYCCSAIVTVNFSPVHLRKNATQFWVVLTGSTNNRLIWFGENGNFTRSGLRGEDYKYALSEVINSTYRTTRYGYHNTYHTSIHESSNGWIHTTAFTFAELGGAFSINHPPP